MKHNSLIDIQLFGAFRDLDESGKHSIQLASGSSVKVLKEKLFLDFENKTKSGVNLAALLKVSVLATEDGILQDSDLLDLDTIKSFAILPPVCGG